MNCKIIYLIALMAISMFTTHAQNPDYRVDKIVNIVQKNETVFDTLVSNFEYSKEGKILKVITTLNGKPEKEEIYNYSPNSITVNDKSGNFIRSYFLDSIDRVVKYKIGMENYVLKYSGNNISQIESRQRIEGEDYIVIYGFNYSSDLKRINKVTYTRNNSPKTEKPGDNDYFFFYNRDPKTQAMTTLKRIDWGNSPFNFRYIVQRKEDKVIAINTVGTDNLIRVGISFIYDEFGNIIEESIKTPRITSGFNVNKYIITYSKNKGNDYIIWDMSDWFYSKFCMQRTYKINKVGSI